MKTLILLMLAVALPVISFAAPARHPAAKKPVHHAVRAVQAVPQPAPTQPAGDRPFSDVPPDHWAAAAVETLRKRGIVNGYPAGTYRTKQ